MYDNVGGQPEYGAYDPGDDAARGKSVLPSPRLLRAVSSRECAGALRDMRLLLSGHLGGAGAQLPGV